MSMYECTSFDSEWKRIQLSLLPISTASLNFRYLQRRTQLGIETELKLICGISSRAQTTKDSYGNARLAYFLSCLYGLLGTLKVFRFFPKHYRKNTKIFRPSFKVHNATLPWQDGGSFEFVRRSLCILEKFWIVAFINK